MYEVTETMGGRTWLVYGPNFHRVYTDRIEASTKAEDLNTAYHEGQLAAYRDACKRITDWKPSDVERAECVAVERE